MAVASPPLSNSELFPAQRRTPLPGGYMGKLLHVDLSTGRCEELNLPDEPILRKLWGGQALGLYLLMHLLPTDARPLDPENVIVFMTGPLTGTGLTPGGTKMTSVFLSPATGYTLGRAATSGFWSVALKGAGYDGVIATGASDRPVYLYLDNGRAELRDASSVWGLGSRQNRGPPSPGGRPPGCARRLYRARRREPRPRGHARQRLQPLRLARRGCRHGIEEAEGNRGAGRLAPSAAR